MAVHGHNRLYGGGLSLIHSSLVPKTGSITDTADALRIGRSADEECNHGQQREQQA